MSAVPTSILGDEDDDANGIVLSKRELFRETGYRRPGDQLAEMLRKGFFRARRSGPNKVLIVERAHYDAVKSGAFTRPTVDVSAFAKPRPPRKPIVFPWSQRTAVYRHFDSSGLLLYVGVAVNPAKREGEHKRESDWGKRIHRIDLEWFDCRRAAMAAEAAAIRAEKPEHNILHTGKA